MGRSLTSLARQEWSAPVRISSARTPRQLIREPQGSLDVLKVVGAIYLVRIGFQTVRTARRAATNQPTGEPTDRRPLRCLRKGFLTNALNPKLAVFFLTFLPQFLPTHGPVLARRLPTAVCSPRCT